MFAAYKEVPCLDMGAGKSALANGAEHRPGFEAMADVILYRWSTERDTWVSASEVEEARAYLARQGITTSALPDGRFALAGESARAFGAERLVFLGLQQLRGTRSA
ncbi:MAG: hypothetical protein E6J79_03740 [Deltaproteobacteria bacterium]|nr:MAG: hypothetical protein E6J79_03740 [Deltaproteobacteria bacterium]